MILIIGVRFRKSSKVYYFDPTGYDIKKGDHVIVETARGIEYGTVVLGPKEVTDDKVVSPLKPLTRPATPEDEKTNIENEKKEKEAYQICLEKIKKHDLKMKLIDSEYTFDRNKLLFYFTADGRIDFRELVKDLASVFRTRIELRQIGVRDETKLLGGMAICGRPLCCHTFLSEFAPVSIKMAKEQGLSLNPTQISGVCGRLMCCLKNEQEAYEELNHSLPSIGSQVKTIDGYTGEVQSTSVLKQLVKIVITKKNGEREIREYPVADLSFKDHQISNEGSELEASLNEMVDAEGLEQLEIMEKQDMEELQEQEEETGKSGGKRVRIPDVPAVNAETAEIVTGIEIKTGTTVVRTGMIKTERIVVRTKIAGIRTVPVITAGIVIRSIITAKNGLPEAEVVMKTRIFTCLKPKNRSRASAVVMNAKMTDAGKKDVRSVSVKNAAERANGKTSMAREITIIAGRTIIPKDKTVLPADRIIK